MGSNNKSKRRTLPANYVYKTADDFIRWQKARDARKKQMPEEQFVPSDRGMSQALMVWEDDGGQ